MFKTNAKDKIRFVLWSVMKINTGRSIGIKETSGALCGTPTTPLQAGLSVWSINNKKSIVHRHGRMLISDWITECVLTMQPSAWGSILLRPLSLWQSVITNGQLSFVFHCLGLRNKKSICEGQNGQDTTKWLNNGWGILRSTEVQEKYCKIACGDTVCLLILELGFYRVTV